MVQHLQRSGRDVRPVSALRWVLPILPAALILSLAGCSQPGGDASCAQFLKSDLVEQEDTVDEALIQHGLTHDQMFDLTMVSMQVQHACELAGDKSAPARDAIAWGTWEKILGN